jgi:hypothetical protein
MTQSGSVLPLPGPSTGSLAVTETILQVGDGSQSVAVAVIETGTSLWFGGQRVSGLATIDAITGATVSVTATVKLQLADCPDWSVTVQVSVVVPIGNAVPDGGAQTTVVGQSSENVGENVATALQAPGSCGMAMFSGQVITGGTVSVTVTVKLQLDVRPSWSVTVQVSVVVPTGNAVADGGSQTTVGEQSSEDVGENVVTAAHVPGSFGWVMSAGQVICGGVRSRMTPPSGRRQISEPQPDRHPSASAMTVGPRTRAGIGHPRFDGLAVICSNASRRQVLGDWLRRPPWRGGRDATRANSTGRCLRFRVTVLTSALSG